MFLNRLIVVEYTLSQIIQKMRRDDNKIIIDAFNMTIMSKYYNSLSASR